MSWESYLPELDMQRATSGLRWKFGSCLTLSALPRLLLALLPRLFCGGPILPPAMFTTLHALFIQVAGMPSFSFFLRNVHGSAKRASSDRSSSRLQPLASRAADSVCVPLSYPQASTLRLDQESTLIHTHNSQRLQLESRAGFHF